jgi:hypothetical protein
MRPRKRWLTKIKALPADEPDDELEAALAEIERAKEASNRVAHFPPEHITPNPQTTNGYQFNGNGKGEPGRV